MSVRPPSDLHLELLAALREAARIGIADAEAGHFHSFASPTELRRHLDSLAQEAIRGRGGERAK